MRSDNWLRTDEQNDVLISLRQVLLQLRNVKKDISNWKWAVIALTKKRAEETIRYFDDTDQKLPDQRLASPIELFQRAIGETDRFERAGKHLTKSSSQKENFSQLCNLRNQFIHFRPTGWSIEVSELPAIFLGVMRIIDEMRPPHNPFLRHIKDTNPFDGCNWAA